MNPSERLKEIEESYGHFEQYNPQVDWLIKRIKVLEEELRVTNELFLERDRVLREIPPCEVHGPCVPHSIEWIKKVKALAKIEGGK